MARLFKIKRMAANLACWLCLAVSGPLTANEVAIDLIDVWKPKLIPEFNLIDNHRSGLKVSSNGNLHINAGHPVYFELEPGEVVELKRNGERQSQPDVAVHLAQGRGIFKVQPNFIWRSERRLLSNTISRNQWVMLRSDYTLDLSIKSRNRFNYPQAHYWFEKELGDDAIRIESRAGGRATQLLKIPRAEPYVYKAEHDERIKVELYADFSEFNDATNLAVAIEWQVDQQTPKIEMHYANRNYRQRYSFDCDLQLSYHKELLFELKAGQTLSLSTTHDSYIGVSSNRAESFLFNANRPQMPASHKAYRESALKQEKWFTVLRALNLPVELDLFDGNNKLTTRRQLVPERDQHYALQLNTVRGSPLERDVNEVFFSKQNSYSNFQKLVHGTFHAITDKQASLRYQLPSHRALKELELEITTDATTVELIPINVGFNNSPTVSYWVSRKMLHYSSEPSLLSAYLEADLVPESGQHVSQSKAFARYREKAPMVRSNIVYIPIPEGASFVELSQGAGPSGSATSLGYEVWVSARDFVYRSNLSDVGLLNEVNNKTISRVLESYDHYRRAKDIASNQAMNGTATDVQSNAASDSDVLIDYLESLPKDAQINLITWARFFESVDEYFAVISEQQDGNATEKVDGFLAFENPTIWKELELWLAGQQPSTAIAVITGAAVQHPDKRVRDKALEVLQGYEGTWLSTSKLEQIVLANLREDMKDLQQRLPLLLELWRKQGKYHLINIMPKPVELAADYAALQMVANQQPIHFNADSMSGLSAEFANLLALYRAHEVETKSNEVERYLNTFGHWRSDQAAIKQFTQYIRLDHNSRPGLSQEAFLIGPQNSIRLRTNDLHRYQLRVAAIFDGETQKEFDDEVLSVSVSVRSAAGNSLHPVSAVLASNWQFENTLDRTAVAVANFSTLEFAQAHTNENDLIISSNRNALVYLQRLEDPIALGRQQATPLEKVLLPANKSAPQNPGVLAMPALKVSIASRQCGEPQRTMTDHHLAFRPVAVSDVVLPHFDFVGSSTELSVSATEQQFSDLERNNLGAAAQLLRIAKDPVVKLRFPDLRAHVFEKVSWREVHDVANHDGRVRFKFKQGAVLSQAALQRRALSEKVLDYAYSISGDTIQGFKLNASEGQTVSLKVLVPKLFYQPSAQVKIWLQHGQQAPRSIVFESGDIKRINLRMVAGSNAIKVWLDKASAQQFASLNIELPGDGSGQLHKSENYYLQQHGKPLTLSVLGPQWLKVVRRNERGEANIQERYVDEGWQSLQFSADDDKRFYRFFVLQENYQPSSRHLEPVPELASAKTCIDEKLCLNRFATQQPQQNYLQRLLAESDDIGEGQYSEQLTSFGTLNYDLAAATWGANVWFVDRSNSDDDFEDLSRFEQRFSELHLYRRQYHEPRDLYLSLDGKIRRYSDDHVYHLGARVDWLPENFKGRFDYVLRAAAWHQASNGSQAGVSSAVVTGRVKYQVNPRQRLRLTSQASIWQRYSDAEDSVNFDLVDPDVWSQYKQDHKNGLSLNQDGTYRLSLDSEAYLTANMRLNQGLSSVDRHSLRLGWRAYLKTASADINLVRRQFAEDEHRLDSFGRTDINVAGDWLLPFSKNSNFRMGARARYSPDEDQLSWWINLGWFDHKGQQLRDFYPGEYRFRQARDWWATQSSIDKLFESRFHD